VFSPGQIVVSAVVNAVLSLFVLLLYARWSGDSVMSPRQAVLVALVAGLSILFWRFAGNVAPLNEDPIPPVSPNDVLCPVFTYVCLGLYSGLRGKASHPRWERMRAALTILSFVVNVVTI
jgi:hypothetical protein